MLGFAAAPRASAQAVAVAEVDGRVTDPSGQVIANANVKITEVAKQESHTAVTDSTGHYVLPNLSVGAYRLEVSAQGFKTYVQSGITLQVASNAQINVTMQIGSVSESVNVEANAGLVETKETTIAQVVDQQRLVDLPLNGRNPTALLTLTGAGTATMTLNGSDLTSSKNIQGSNGSGTFSVAGSQANGISFLLDGGDNNDAFSNVNLPLPFPDALQEFNVQTSSLPAQYGNHPGGVVNVVTKSGTNDLHGDLFEFLRNGALNARQRNTPARDSLKRSQFGGTVGGRILRDKLFFFGGFQGTEQRSNPPSSISYVPTAAVQAGNFSLFETPQSQGGCLSSSSARALKDPAGSNGAVFPNNQIPPSRFDPAAIKLITNYLPQATTPCGLVQYGIPANNPDQQYISRIDWVIGPKHNLFGRYYLYDYTAQTTFDGKNVLTTTTPGNKQRAQTMTLGDTYTLSPSMVNSFHATFTRRRNNRGAAPNLISPLDLGINQYVAIPHYINLAVSNYNINAGCGTCAPGFFNVNNYQVSDDFLYIKSKHQIGFGFDYRRVFLNINNAQQVNGIQNFNGAWTGDALADLMIGKMSSFVQGNANPNALRQNVFALYAQDTYHATNHLTINLGLRWEPSQPPYDKWNMANQFNMALYQAGVRSSVYPNAPPGLIFPKDPQNKEGRGLTAAHWNLFSPRLGIVYDPKGDGKQTIRAGFALMHDTTELYYPERWTTNPPYASSVTVNNPPGTLTNPWQGYVSPTGVPGSPFPGAAIFPSAGTYITVPPHVSPTYTMLWNFSYQRQVGKDWLLQANYIGNKTTHVWGSYDLNPSVYIPGSTASTNQRRLLYLQNPSTGQYYSSIEQTDDGGNASYHGLLLSVNHRFSNHFTLLSNYTWSHCISDVDFLGELTGPLYQNPNNRAGERSSCGFDHRHIFNNSLVAISSGVGPGALRLITKDWQLSPILSLYSGVPLNVVTGKDISLSGQNQDRPNLAITSGIYSHTTQAWFNPAAFVNQPTGTFGNLGRLAVRGPGAFNFDVAISRQFRFTERFRLDLRSDMFNILNHPNWGNPSVSMTSSTFSQITSFSSPRIIQMSMKLYF